MAINNSMKNSVQFGHVIFEFMGVDKQRKTDRQTHSMDEVTSAHGFFVRPQ